MTKVSQPTWLLGKVPVFAVFRRVHNEAAVVQPVHAIICIRTRALRAVVGVIECVESSKLQERSEIRRRVNTNSRWAVATATVASADIAVGPVHVEVTHLRVRSVWQIFRILTRDDDLVGVEEIRALVVVANIYEIDEDLVLGDL